MLWFMWFRENGGLFREARKAENKRRTCFLSSDRTSRELEKTTHPPKEGDAVAQLYFSAPRSSCEENTWQTSTHTQHQVLRARFLLLLLLQQNQRGMRSPTARC